MRLALTLALTFSLGACTPLVREGHFSCNAGGCPEGWFCRADSRCYSTPGETDSSSDATAADASSRDSAPDAKRGDAMGMDALVEAATDASFVDGGGSGPVVYVSADADLSTTRSVPADIGDGYFVTCEVDECPALVPGFRGSAWSLTNSASADLSGPRVIFGDAYTVSFYLYLESGKQASTVSATIDDKLVWILFGGDGYHEVGMYAADGRYRTITARAQPIVGSWVHVALGQSGTTAFIRIAGEPMPETLDWTAPVGIMKFQLGSEIWGNPDIEADARIDEFRVFDRMLSEDELAALDIP